MSSSTSAMKGEERSHPENDPSSPSPRLFPRPMQLACLVILGVVLVACLTGQLAVCTLPRMAWRDASAYFPRGNGKLKMLQGQSRFAIEMTGNDLSSSSNSFGFNSHPSAAKRSETTVTLSTSPIPTALECFQVTAPVLTPEGAAYQTTAGGNEFVAAEDKTFLSSNEPCTALLMEHTFAFSYGMPFIGDYKPPACQFNRVVLNFTVTSEGRQYDRLALMYFGDTEVWRTSTAEPKVAPGIRWTYLKDMTEYLYFWNSPQKLIFDLGNLVNENYTASWNTTLTATFFTSSVETETAPPSDLIIPISKRQGAAGAVSHFTVPKENATNTITFPQNARRAVFSISACGQASEEFWWSNVFQSDTYAFNATAGAFPGFSPWREVQLWIDGRVAGVQWPFPVIFTGGVVPGLHRPIVGLDAFDLREHQIDITPFLPILCDGSQHTFSIRVVGLDDTKGGSSALVTKTVGDSWYVTGKIFVWLDEDENSVTTGDPPIIEGDGPMISLSHTLGKASNGTNETLDYNIAVDRSFKISGRVVTQKSSQSVSWAQSLSYSNRGYISSFGNNQINTISIKGGDTSAGPESYAAEYSYPLYANTTFSGDVDGNMTLHGHVVQGLHLYVRGSSVFPTGLEAFISVNGGRRRFTGGSIIDTTKEGTATFFQTGGGRNSSGFGSSTQVFRLGGISARGILSDNAKDDPGVELFFRHVSAVNDTVVADTIRIGSDGRVVTVARDEGDGNGRSGEWGLAHEVFSQASSSGGSGPRVFMGRGSQVG
ncbi:hypothetical protein VTK73DRAFT_3329 [Phialemonium thermophilum]|uniref:Peptide N-acetyl-beta-D-glucosaminyl asparaginase amidase A N-terminal domain-containing protein n=1 Tax=Phialemonium thermophilum TaxID=223376 RepID=A0ABR3WZQ9_9PEZI